MRTKTAALGLIQGFKPACFLGIASDWGQTHTAGLSLTANYQPTSQTWGCSSKRSIMSRNLPYPRTVPAPGRRGQPPCPLPYRLPKLSLATSRLSLVFNLWPGLANTTIQKKLSSLAKGKASSPCLGFIWEQFCSLKEDGAPPGLGGHNLRLGLRKGSADLPQSNPPNGFSSLCPLPCPSLIQLPKEFKGGKKAPLRLLSNPSFCSFLHFTMGVQSSLDLARAQNKLHISCSPA